MTTPDAAAQYPPAPEGVKDFTVVRKPKTFYIAPDLFTAPPVLIPDTMRDLANLHAGMGSISVSPDNLDDLGKLLDAVSAMFALFLPGVEGEKFIARLRDPINPIGLLDQALPVVYWLLEEYGFGRPTVPSSPSPTGSTDGQTNDPSDGISSTAGASPTDSAPAVVDLTSPTGSI